jgi:hypothetical protein
MERRRNRVQKILGREDESLVSIDVEQEFLLRHLCMRY